MEGSVKIHAHDRLRAVFEEIAEAERPERVRVWLVGGIEIEGTVAEAGDRAVILKALAGREFYDAHVRYEHVTCVEVKTRS